MADQRPAPPVPVDLDLRDFPFMPLDVLRLRDSDLATLATGEEFKAAVLLWCASWHQVPAGSVPKDERWLARHSGAGSAWKKVREEALRGFVEHSDGRLYHVVVVEKALTSWQRKGEQKVRTLKARVASMAKRLDAAATDEDRTHVQAMLSELRRQLSQAIGGPVTQPATQPVAEPVTDPVTSTNREGQGYGEGEGQGEGDLKKGEEGADAPAPPADQPAPAASEPEPEAEPDADPYPPLPFDRSAEAEALNLWNAAAERVGWPKAQRLTDTRRRALKLRLAECGGLDGWSTALSKAEASAFLTGKTGRTGGHENWRCDLDFILRQAKFTKLLEGGFDDPPGGRRGGPGSQSEALFRGAMSVAGTKPLKGILDQ